MEPAPAGENDAGLRGSVVELIELVETPGVPAVFMEPQIEHAILRKVAAEAGVEVGTLLADSFPGEIDAIWS